jgi:hypothetical protein
MTEEAKAVSEMKKRHDALKKRAEKAVKDK